MTGDNEGIEVRGSSHDITNNGKIVTNIGDGVDFVNSDNNTLNNFGEIVGYNDGRRQRDREQRHNQCRCGRLRHKWRQQPSVEYRRDHCSRRCCGALHQRGRRSQHNCGTIAGADVDGNAIVGGDDVFNGVGGTVVGSVSGGAGDDLYIVDDPTLTIVENAGKGHDTVIAHSSFTLEANIEDLNLVGGGDTTGVGNNLANVINGNIGDNLIEGRGGDDTLRGGDGDDVIRGGGGADQLVGSAGDDEIHGGPGEDNLLGAIGNDDLFGGNQDDHLAGGLGDDLLVGGSGEDRLIGGSGEDILIGGADSDVLIGRPDADRFVFNSAVETPVGSGNGRINQFSSAKGDLIDLSAIDADVGTAGDDGFTFIGTSAFSGSAGELRFVAGGSGNVTVFGDTDGDGDADFEILVANTASLSAGDFVL